MSDTILYEGDTAYGHYQIVDTIYEGRAARVLFSGDHSAAQSGVPKDQNTAMLFDYNQRLLELALEKQPQRLLIIGGGGYTLPVALSAALPATYITVVEIDAGLQLLAEQYFGLQPSDHLQLVTSEGRAYLEACREQYDLIIIDAFNHVTIPGPLATIEAVQATSHCLAADGLTAMNVIAAFYGRRGSLLRTIYAAFAQVYAKVGLFPASTDYSMWQQQNFILTGQQSGNLPSQLRYDRLMELDTSPQEARRDSVAEA